MERNYIFLLALLLVLLVNGCSAVDLKGNAGDDSGLDPNFNDTNSSTERTGGSDLAVNSAEDGKVKEDRGAQVNKLKAGVNIKNDLDKNNSSKELDSKADKSNGDSNEELRTREGVDKRGNLTDEGKSKDVLKEGAEVEDLDSLRKEGTLVEECDSSNKCMDDDKSFVACLRVPGNDSPNLSLLIQNKVKGPLTVRISAPDNVQPQKTEVQLREKEHEELKISVSNRGTENLIILMAGNGNCSLDFGDLIAHSSGEESYNSPKSTYFNLMSGKPTVIFISFAALLILASGCMCVSFRWRQLSTSSSKYQRIEMELPISATQKSDLDVNDGWDNSWGDDWDDEEAAKTPSMPVTPSLSSKGLASRRLSKESWKD